MLLQTVVTFAVLLAVALGSPELGALARGAVINIQPTYRNGSVTVETLSVPSNLDGPKITTAVNASSFDFWYFGAVSASTDASVIITFFNSAILGSQNPLVVQVSGSFPNGTLFTGEALATSDAVLRSSSKGIAGVWGGTGAIFKGTNLDKPHISYEITLDMPNIGIKGTVTLKSLAPPRYPCDLNVPRASQELLPHLFWSNAVPNAEAIVNLDINGTSLSFTKGVGYHDKNWGDAPVYTSARSWDWGHASFGPYSVVWFDLLDRTNTEHVSAFVSVKGKPIMVSCRDQSLRVRQWGGNATYPPVSGLGHVHGISARFNLGNGEVLVANMTNSLLIEDLGGGIFTRAIGSVKGGIEGQQVFEGRAIYDENIFG